MKWKAFINWGKSRSKLEMFGWAAWLVGLGVLAFVDAPAALGGYLLCLFCLCWSISHHWKKSLSILLIASLLFSQAPQTHAQAQPKLVNCNAAVIGGLVLIVGGIIIYKFAKFCKKHFPPPGSNPPPDDGGTNAPPSTNAANATIYFPTLTPHALVESYDCTSTGWLDRSVPANPVPVQDFIILSFSSSTNLNDWTNCFTVNLWLSSNSVVGVVYDANQRPISTNRTLGNPYTTALTNALAFPLFTRSQPQLFFRDY